MQEELLESAEFYQRRYHHFSSLLIVPVAVLAIFGLLFAAVVKKEITVSTKATIEASRVLAAIQSTSSNPIITNHLEDNKEVKKGELLVLYKATGEQIQEENLSQDLQVLKDQREKLDLLKKSLEMGVSQFTEMDSFGYQQTFEDYQHQVGNLTSQYQQQNATIASQNATSSQTQAELGLLIEEAVSKLAQYQELRQALAHKTGLASGHPLYPLYQSGNLTDVDSQIGHLEDNLANYRIQYAGSGSQQAYAGNLSSQVGSLKAQYLTKASQDSISLDQQMRELESKVKIQGDLVNRHEIKASSDGILHLNPEVIGQTLITEGTTMAQLYPKLTDEKTIKMVAYLSSKEIVGVTAGQSVRFSGLDDKRQTFHVNGRVSKVAKQARSTKDGNLFQVEAIAQLNAHEARLLRYGLEGKFVLITGRKTYLQYFWDSLVGDR